MFFDTKKKNENVVEYVLYMWQIEDLLRSCDLNMDLVEDRIISSYSPDAKLDLIRKWYLNIIKEMKEKKLFKSGHIEEVQEAISELAMLHNMLINLYQDERYLKLYEKCKDSIDELKKKSNNTLRTDIDACLNGLYGILILRLQNKTISEDTMEAIKQFSLMMAYLAKKYKEMKEGNLDFPTSINN
ncbi:MAG: DUF4924 family protein [Flavobacteriales bacterium]|nr:DUF4924 family protein [Flavobacteriales bacterium]